MYSGLCACIEGHFSSSAVHVGEDNGGAPLKRTYFCGGGVTPRTQRW